MIQDLHVTQEFVSLLNEINETRFLKVNYGGVWSHDRDPLGQQVSTVYAIIKAVNSPQAFKRQFMNSFQLIFYITCAQFRQPFHLYAIATRIFPWLENVLNFYKFSLH